MRIRDGRPNQLASRGRRIAAAVIDAGVLTTVVVNVLAGVSGGDLWEADGWRWWLLLAALMGGHELIGTALWGQTLGKRLFGIRVVRDDTFGVPGWRRAAMRSFGLMPAGLVPHGDAAAGAADTATFFFNRRRRSLHDLMSGTTVVDDRPWRRWATSPEVHP